MQVKDVMNSNLISCDPDDTISRALSKMKANSIHQVIVSSNGNLYGLLELKNVVTRDIDITTTKVASLAINAPVIDMDTPVEAAVDRLLRAGLRAMPVTSAGRLVGIISETDLMKVARDFVKGLNTGAHEIVTPAEYVARTDNIGKVRKIMLERNVSRVPVVDRGRVVGVLGTIDLIKLMEGKERMPARGGRLTESGAMEKIRTEGTMAEAIMRPATIVGGSSSISEVIDLLQTNEEVIVDNEGSVGVLTPKDILELFALAPKRQVYVQITGMQNESIEFKVKMDQAVNEFVQKMGKRGDIQYLYFHVERFVKGGNRDLYSIRARFKMPFGFFAAHAAGWSPINVIQDCIRKLEKETEHRHGKLRERAKTRRQKARFA